MTDIVAAYLIRAMYWFLKGLWAMKVDDDAVRVSAEGHLYDLAGLAEHEATH